jgi:hypothetical protein
VITLHVYVEYWEEGPVEGQPFATGRRRVSRRLALDVPVGTRLRSIDVRRGGLPVPGNLVAWLGDADDFPEQFDARARLLYTNTVGYVHEEPLT